MSERVPVSLDSIYANSASKPSRYRPEIDGLRAFAVVAVIINHFNKDILPGGYLGVDIFFVISGYVITSSLFGRPSKDFKDFISGFYERRIKRLVPALSVFVLITCIAICLFNPTPDPSLRTGITSLFGLSNLYLLKQSTDYFAQSTELNVFTHTWSLGVEEQFYILFPFLIWFSGFGRQTKNGARNLFVVVGALTIASLIGFLYLYPTNQPAAYFLMSSRFWEMASGCLIFIGFQKRASFEQLLEKVPPLLVIALIVAVMYLPMSLAAVSTVAVVVLSSILIACLKKQTAAFKVFTNPRVVYIGLISFSLYLWHWGVLSISRWTIGIHWWSVPFQVALMLGLAIVSYRWIETPLRKGNWFGKRWKTLVVGGGVLVTLSGGLVALGKPLKGKIYVGAPKKEITPLTSDGKSIRDKCYTNTRSSSEIFRDCMFAKSNTSRTLWLVGDSHGEAMLYAASEIASRQKMNLFTYFYGATAFPSTPYVRTDSDEMLSSSKIMLELQNKMISHFRDGDIVIIGMRHPYHFGKDWYEYQSKYFRFLIEDGKFLSSSNKDLYFKQWNENLARFATLAKDHKVNIIISTPTPEFPTAKGKRCKGVDEQWFNKLSRHDCGDISSDFLTGKSGIYNSINKSLRQLADHTPNIYLFDAFSSICPTRRCPRILGEHSLYSDDDHVSNYGSREMILPALQEFMTSNNI